MLDVRVRSVTGVERLLVVAAALGACAGESASPCEVGDAPLTLVSTQVRDHYVRLDLEYSGGCEDHEFAVWWSGLVGPSSPPDVAMTIQHHDHGDGCEALIRESIWLDLSPLHQVGLGTDRFLIRFHGLPGVVDYTVAEPAPPPSADVLEINQSCDAC